MNRRFYGGRSTSLPWAGSFLGHGSLALDYVADGTGMPDPDTGAVESVDAEVAASSSSCSSTPSTRPQESLMVITASEKHAVRVMQAVLAAIAERSPTRPTSSSATARSRSRCCRSSSAVAQSRDRVIFSIGYGRTPHGRVLSDFGALGEPGGERLLAVAMTRARRSIVDRHLLPARATSTTAGMQHGAVALAEILGEVGRAGSRTAAARRQRPDARRPRPPARGSAGSASRSGTAASSGSWRPTAASASSSRPTPCCTGASLRESLRLRPEVLRRLGWHYLRVHAFELFSDPDAVARPDRALLGANAGSG